MKYFKFLTTIDELTLMALAKREFYDKNYLHKDMNRVNAIFFKYIGPQNRMQRNAFIVKTEEDVKINSSMEGNEKLSFTTVKKHPVHFYLNINHLLMMFLWLIPMSMVDQRPTYLFDFKNKG